MFSLSLSLTIKTLYVHQACEMFTLTPSSILCQYVCSLGLKTFALLAQCSTKNGFLILMIFIL